MYIAELIYGSFQYPCGWLKPEVVRGYFTATEQGRLQRVFYEELLRRGFTRTYWQLVFPGQTAGLIKKVNKTDTGIDEYHIRFYDDGTIECELEFGRWSLKHWSGHREYSKLPMMRILEESSFSKEEKSGFYSLFGTKDYADGCVLKIS